LALLSRSLSEGKKPMTMLLNQTITGALSAQLSGTLQTRGALYPDSLIIKGNLTYGSGGTTIDVWVQTSLDGGTSWNDVANFHWNHLGL
jgi:hypothetical protein